MFLLNLSVVKNLIVSSLFADWSMSELESDGTGPSSRGMKVGAIRDNWGRDYLNE